MLRKRPANSAHEFDELMSTMRMASMRGRGGSAMSRWGDVARLHTAAEFLLSRNEDAEVEWVHGNRDLPVASLMRTLPLHRPFYILAAPIAR